MASNPPQAISSKASSSSNGQSSPAQSQAGSLATGDFGQKRSGGSGSFGAGAASRSSPSPRNNQASKKQHKPSKRFRLTDEDAMAESAAMRSTSSRKGQTSITHLMNFSLPPRPHFNHTNTRHRGVRRPTWGLGSGYHAVDKARYVHANYRFLVDPRFNYHQQSIDADIHLDWSNILQILVSSVSQESACPICLGMPVAPRMAKCGHIFCLPCLIRYMHSEDEVSHVPEKKARWKKCPLCWDSIYISETRPVRWYTGQEGIPPREGADVVLRLVTRSAGSTMALPRDGAAALPKDEEIPWHNAAEVMDYARIMKGSEDYMNEQFDGYVTEIQLQEKEDELMFGEDNMEWTHKAVRMLNEAKEKIAGIGNPPSLPSKPVEPRPKRPPIKFNEDDSDVPAMYSIQHVARSGQSLPNGNVETPKAAALGAGLSAPSEFSGKPRQPSISSSTGRPLTGPMHHASGHQAPSEYFFYQALLHYYLSPLDIRILREAFGTFSTFPSTILPRVERVSTGHIVDDDLRRRTKYLAHLPYGCEVGFLECDWTDTVPPEVLEKFKPEIERRRKKNHEKETREEKARIRAEKDEEDKRYASARRRRPSMSGDRFTPDDFAPLVNADVGGISASLEAESTSSSPPWPIRRQGSAFGPLASPSTSPNTSRTVWGTAAVAPTSPQLHALAPTAPPEPHADDGWLQGWEKDLLQEDELLAQAQAMSLGESSTTGAAGGGKKKKGKKITLMSTNVRRGA